MPVINRVRVTLTGFQGGPGLSTFYCLDPATFLPLLRTFYNSMQAHIPSAVTVNFPTTGDILESTTGVLTGSWSAAAQAQATGTNTGSYAAPVGLVVHWNTTSIINGHRVVGRTFLVPLAGNSFQNDGTPNASAIGEILAIAQTFQTAAASNFVVWSRPVVAKPSPPVRPPVPARAGGHVPVTGVRVPDLAAVLTSRRD